MVVPAAMTIEEAQDWMKKLDPQQLKAQEKEVRFTMGENPPLTDREVYMYNLGLQTMRTLIVQNPNAAKLTEL
jgi:hypothetical protein